MATQTQTRAAAKAAAEAQKDVEPDEDQEEGFEPVLVIDTLAPKRPTVRIMTPKDREGQEYEMHVPGDFGVEEEQLFRSEMREYDALYQKDGLTKAEKKRLTQRLDELSRKILMAPPEIIATLTDRQRRAVILRFTSALFADDAAVLPPEIMARMLGSIMAT